MMTFGQERLLLHLSKIKYILLNQSPKKIDVHYIYSKDVRTPLFMMEGICRLYRKIYDTSYFEEMLSLVKRLEDAIGQYDFYVSTKKQLTNINTPDSLITELDTQIEQSSKQVATIITNDKWTEKSLYSKTIKDLDKIDWLDEKDELKAIEKTFKKEIEKIHNYISSLPDTLDNMEDQVHELRRKLRWLSIYTHALDGLVMLEKDAYEAKQEPYLTNNIINSPFNQIIPHLKYNKHLALSATHFYILSWMIDKIGSIKDKGLMIEYINHSPFIEINDKQDILHQLSLNETMEDLLSAANGEIQKYHNNNYLNKLLI